MTRPAGNQCTVPTLKGRSLIGMAGEDTVRAVTWLDKWCARRTEPVLPPGMFTVKQVGDACGLPGPVIMQWVPRTWVDGVGWMFTDEQLREAVTIAAQWRRSRAASEPLRQPDPTDVIVCDGCGGLRSLMALRGRCGCTWSSPTAACTLIQRAATTARTA